MSTESDLCCVSCRHYFEPKQRIPYFGSCGHSICALCFNNSSTGFCFGCNVYSFTNPIKNYLAEEFLLHLEERKNEITTAKKVVEEIKKGVKKPVIVDDHKAVAHFMIGDSLVSEGDHQVMGLDDLCNRIWVVLVKNLPPVNEDLLRQKFRDVGNIVKLVICEDIFAKQSGEAYIWFGSREEAVKALKLTGTKLRGQDFEEKTVTVEIPPRN